MRLNKSVVIVITLYLAFYANAGAQTCGGIERWKVKTMQDIPVIKASNTPVLPMTSTIEEENKISRPSGKWFTLVRQPDEMQMLAVRGTIIEAGEEADNDYHLVLRDGIWTMICEIPDPDCPDVVHSPFAAKWRAARAFVDAHCGKITRRIRVVKHVDVTITGMGFWDKPAHGTGHAINGREIHPVLTIQ